MNKILRYSLLTLVTAFYSTVFAEEPGAVPATALTVAQALEKINALDNAQQSEDMFWITGVVTSIEQISTQYGNATFYIKDENGTDQLYIYRAKGFGNEKITSEDFFKVGDVLYIRGYLKKYVKDDTVTPEITNGYIHSVNGKGKDVIEGGDIAPNDDPEDYDPFHEFKFTSGNFTDTGDQLVFEFEGFLVEEAISGVFTFNFEKDLCTSVEESITFATEELAQTAYAEAVAEAEEEGYTSVKIDGKTVTAVEEGMTYLSRIVIKAMLKMSLDEEDAGYGTQESPMTANLANIYAGTLESGEVTEDDCYVKGKIARITYPFDAQHGTATFFISADGKDDFTFQAYSVYYLENKAWQDGDTQIQVGDDVVICGKLTNYKGTTPETASKRAYIYSLNGVTSGISAVQSEQTNASVYNLAGQRVEKAVKGIYIQNGKKFIVK